MMPVAEGNSSDFVGARELELMKKPGRGKYGHIAIKTNSLVRAIAHLELQGAVFDRASLVEKNGKPTAIYLADEIAGFAVHLVQK